MNIWFSAYRIKCTFMIVPSIGIYWPHRLSLDYKVYRIAFAIAITWAMWSIGFRVRALKRKQA